MSDDLRNRSIQFLLRTREVYLWIEEMTQIKFNCPTLGILEALKDGEKLCLLANAFTNNSIKRINKVRQGITFNIMASENIQAFFKACKTVKIPEYSLFLVEDLLEQKGKKTNPFKVISFLYTLSHTVAKLGDFARLVELNEKEVTFEESELLEGEAIVATSKSDIRKGGLDRSSSVIQFGRPRGDTKIEPVKPLPKEPELKSPKRTDSFVAKESPKRGDSVKFDSPVKLGEVPRRDSSFFGMLTHGHRTVEPLDNRPIKVVEPKIQEVKPVEPEKPKIENTQEVNVKPVEPVKEPDVTPIDPVNVIEREKPKDVEPSPRPIVPVIPVLHVKTPEPIKGSPRVIVPAEPIKSPREIVKELEVLKDPVKSPREVTKLQTKPTLNRLSTEPPADLLSNPIDPTKCTLSITEDHLNLPAGHIAHFFINAYDKDGLKTGAIETFTAELIGEADTEVTIKNMRDGRWKVSYSCLYASDYQLIVKFADQIIGTPIKINCIEAGEANPQSSAILDIPVHQIPAGEPFVFRIQARDDYGNKRIKGGDNFIATIDEKVIVLNDLDDGQYVGNFVTDCLGEYDLNVELKQSPIQRSPFKFTITEGVFDPIESIVTLPSNFPTIIAGERQVVFIEGRDKFGNVKVLGGDEFDIILKGNTDRTQTKITDLHNGKYQVEISLIQAGVYSFSIVHKGFGLKGFPIELLKVIPAPTSIGKTTFKGEQLKKSISKKQSEFIVSTFDEFGNLTPSIQVSVKFVNSQTGAAVQGTVKNQNDGTHLVSYMIDVTSDTDFETQVWINGENYFETRKRVLTIYSVKIGTDTVDPDDVMETNDHGVIFDLWKKCKDEPIDSWIHKIEEVRERIVEQVKLNTELDTSVKNMDKVIELLIQNRFKEKKTTAGPIIKNEAESKQYGNFFYILQTEPKYLAKALLNISTDQFDELLEIIMLHIFGSNFAPREEFLLLKVFHQTLLLEMGKEGSKIGEFLNSNAVIPRMVMAYGKRVPGRAYLQKVLFSKILSPILQMKNMDLELNPHKILTKFINSTEAETGVKSTIDLKNVTASQILGMDNIRKEVQLRTQILQEILNGILEEMTSTIDQMPYGLRYFCRLLNQTLIEKHPLSKEIERLSVIGYVIYYRFMNPVLILPDSYDLTKSQITPQHRANLLSVSKVLTQLTTVTDFDAKNEEHMYVMNDWLERNQEKYFDFIRIVMDVDDPDLALDVDEYTELVLRDTPQMKIKLNDVYSVHRNLYKILPTIAPEKKDPLNIILTQMDKAKDSVDPDHNLEIKLDLSSQFKVTTTLNIDLLYEKCLVLFRKILMLAPQDVPRDSVYETIEAAKIWAGEEHNDLVLQYANELDKIASTLIDFKKIQKGNRYKEMLIDINKHMKDELKSEKEKREYQRYCESLSHLQEHQRFLEEKMSDYDEYLKRSIRNDYKKIQGKPTKKHEFSFKKFDAKGVIADINVMKNMRKGVSFVLYMSESGVFNIDALVNNLVAKSITENVTELLQKNGKGIDKLEYGYVTLHTGKVIDLLNELFLQ